MPPFLTKSKFLAGEQCLKRLWLEVHRRDLKPPVTPAQQMVFDQGHEIGELATQRFPGGVMVDHSDFFGAVRETRSLMSSDVPTIFEASFAEDRLYARVDVLRRTPGGWDIIEVKSSTRVKREHIEDVAFQRALLERAGVTVTGCFLVHVDNSYVHPDEGDLLALEDISEDVTAVRPRVEAEFPNLLAVIDGPMPEVPVGPHCDAPYTCPFKDVCWEDLPDANVFTIPYAGQKAVRLYAEGCVHACDAGDYVQLTANQQAYVNVLNRGEPVFDAGCIRAFLADLEYPLYFLDFETLGLALPRFEGVRPYQHVPFQFSCHVVSEDAAEPTHAEYLHGDETDPRPPLVEALLGAVRPVGSVVVYNARFERGVLEDLAGRFPSRADELFSIRDRLWDLHEVVKKHVEHPDFLGSKSIKSVLPALVPNLGYSGLEIADGQHAGAMWLRMIDRRGDHYWEGVRQDLLAYCRLDTLGMVRIWEVLSGKAESV